MKVNFTGAYYNFFSLFVIYFYVRSIIPPRQLVLKGSNFHGLMEVTLGWLKGMVMIRVKLCPWVSFVKIFWLGS